MREIQALVSAKAAADEVVAFGHSLVSAAQAAADAAEERGIMGFGAQQVSERATSPDADVRAARLADAPSPRRSLM